MIVERYDDLFVQRIEQLTSGFDPADPPLLMTSGVPRSEGLHLTQITSDLYGYHHDPDDCSGNARMTVGFAWEHVLSQVLGLCFVHPEDAVVIHASEVSLDGIAMSPDSVWVSRDFFEEYKCTWKKVPSEFEGYGGTWLWQAKAYAKALEIDTVIYRILHINGNYHKGTGPCRDNPCVVQWRIQFTQQELDDNWAMILQHAEDKGWL